MIDDWNPDDPDTVKVVYDLSSWNFDQQADVAAELAEAGIPHTWDGADLLVPEELEAAVDALVGSLEQRFGITYDDADGTERHAGDDASPAPAAARIDITDGEPCTEYDLGDWTQLDRTTLSHTLTRQGRPFRWEGEVLLVHTTDEDMVEPLLDLIETGDFVEVDESDFDDDAEIGELDGDQLPFEILTTFFLAADRLRRNPLDVDGLEQMVEAGQVNDPRRAPYGVDRRLWKRTCALSDELIGALVDGDAPDDDAVRDLAEQLHTLLRPYI